MPFCSLKLWKRKISVWCHDMTVSRSPLVPRCSSARMWSINPETYNYAPKSKIFNSQSDKSPFFHLSIPHCTPTLKRTIVHSEAAARMNKNDKKELNMETFRKTKMKWASLALLFWAWAEARDKIIIVLQFRHFLPCRLFNSFLFRSVFVAAFLFLQVQPKTVCEEILL